MMPLPSPTQPISTELPERIFRISPLIRLTLMLLYIALTLPLPALAAITDAPLPGWGLWLGIGLGGGLIYGGLSERVQVTPTGIQVGYPGWIRWALRRQWALRWDQIGALKPRSTGQGGLVYYFTTQAADRAYLLPMRVAGFAELLRYVEAYTALDTRDVKPLAQPWMYLILLGFSLLLLLVDGWTLWTAAHFQGMA